MPINARPAHRFDWAGGTRGFVALVIALIAIGFELLAQWVGTFGNGFSGFVVLVTVALLVPAAALACGFAGAWKGPARRNGIIAGILMLLPPLGVLAVFLPFSLFYVIAIGTFGFIGHLLGKKFPPERRFD